MHLKKKKNKVYSPIGVSDDVDYVDVDDNNVDDTDSNMVLEPTPSMHQEKEGVFESSPTAATSFELSVRNILRNPEKHRDEHEHLCSNLGPIASEYLRNVFSGPPKSQDNVYGVYFHNNKLMLGNVAFDVEINDDIVINKIRYRGTPGLYALIFKRIPNENLYTENDKEIYRNILIATHTHRRGNQMMGNKGYKYKTVIGPMFWLIV
ncbi:uncharacterized protein LOC143261242 isoform X1 [Megalopta genalis]|uniref:uncharacterized protein LOC143261242 isoform X1 n=1 Tax=Megalopta genalis TaxID=115081 RepID=UPI003FCF8CBB